MRALLEWFQASVEEDLPQKGRLSEWRRDAEAVVVDLPGTDRLSARLRELGILPGVRLRVLRTGSRLVVQIGEDRFALRRADAAAILVSAAGPAAA